MQAQRKYASYRLILVSALALLAVAGLLWWASGRAPEIQAWTRCCAVDTASRSDHLDVGVAWTSMTPVITTVTKAGTVWKITQHGVTVTFRFNSLPSSETAVFTFTPQSGQLLDPPLISSYVFRLEGRYPWGDLVSMSDYDIALEYEVSQLGGAQEQSVRFYHCDEPPLSQCDVIRNIVVDTAEHVISGTTNDIGLFALGGYPFQGFVPLVLQSATGASSAASTPPDPLSGVPGE